MTISMVLGMPLSNIMRVTFRWEDGNMPHSVIVKTPAKSTHSFDNEDYRHWLTGSLFKRFSLFLVVKISFGNAR